MIQITFSIGPPTRWSAERKSPELRIYRSLPSRHQDYREPLEDLGFDDRTLPKPEYLRENSLNAKDCIGDIGGSPRDVNEANEKNTSINERTKRERPIGKGSEEEVPSPNTARFSKKAAGTGKEQEDPAQEPSTPRISLIKPPRILAKFVSPETKSSPKHGERKSNIPIFRRSSKEFEDIRSPQESPKRSLIPQRYNSFFIFLANGFSEMYNFCTAVLVILRAKFY